jgi:hypothetical protein
MISPENENESIVQSIKIAAPCNVDWNSMTGDERKRLCGQCKLHVYNIEKLTSAEVVSLIQVNEGKVCMQIFRRKDGTILTENCPVGLRKLRDKAKRLMKSAAVFLTWLGLTTSTNAQNETYYTRGEPIIEKGRVNTAETAKPVSKAINTGAPSKPTVKCGKKKVFKSNFVPEQPSYLSKKPYFPFWVELCQLLTPSLAIVSTVVALVTLNITKRARPTTIGLILLAIWLSAGLLMGYLWSPALKVMPFN